MVSSGDVEEQVFFTTKVFILQKLTIILWDSVNEMPMYFDMPWNYTIDNVSIKSVAIQMSGNENMWL
jgi:hypothetical protein